LHNFTNLYKCLHKCAQLYNTFTQTIYTTLQHSPQLYKHFYKTKSTLTQLNIFYKYFTQWHTTLHKHKTLQNFRTTYKLYTSLQDCTTFDKHFNTALHNKPTTLYTTLHKFTHLYNKLHKTIQHVATLYKVL